MHVVNLLEIEERIEIRQFWGFTCPTYYCLSLSINLLFYFRCQPECEEEYIQPEIHKFASFTCHNICKKSKKITTNKTSGKFTRQRWMLLFTRTAGNLICTFFQTKKTLKIFFSLSVNTFTEFCTGAPITAGYGQIWQLV